MGGCLTTMTRRWVLARHVDGAPVPQDFRLETAELPDLAEGQFIARTILASEQETKMLQHRLATELEEKTQEAERRRLEHRALLLIEKQKAELAQANSEVELRSVRLTARERESVVDLAELERRQGLEMTFLVAQTDARVRQAQAMSPELSASLTRLGDAQLLSSLAENFGELAAVEARGLLETARKYLDFVPQSSLPMLKGAPRGDAE